MAQIYSGRDVGRFVEPLLRGAKRFLLVASPWISGEYARLLVEKARSGAVVYVVTSDARGNEAALRVFSAACGGGSGGGGRVSWPRFLAVLLLLGFGVPLLAVYLAAEHDWPWLMAAWGLAALYAAYRLVASGWGLLLIPVGAAPWYLVFYAAYRLGLSGEPPRLEGGYLVVLALLGAYTAGVAVLAWEMSRVKAVEAPGGAGAWNGNGGLHVLVVPSRLMSHAKILVADGGAVVGSANLTRSGLWRNMETVTVYAPQEAGPIEAQFWSVWEDARRSAESYIGCGAALEDVEWVEPDGEAGEGPVLEEQGRRGEAGSSRHAQRRGRRKEPGETGGEEGDPCGDDIIDLLLERGTEDPEVERRLREYMECRAKWFIERFDEYEKSVGIRVDKD